MEDTRNAYKIYEEGSIGEVRIADDVVASIAALAAMEVEGVASLVGNITNELISKLGVKNLSKGVTTTLEEEKVTVNISLNLEYGYNVLEVSKKVQDKVKTAIENMTGLFVEIVNVKIASVNVQK